MSIIIRSKAQWGVPNIPPFDKQKSKTITTRYRDGSPAGPVNMNKSMMYAIIAMILDPDKVAAIQVTDDLFVIEYNHSDGSTHLVSYNKANGVLEMTCVVGSNWSVVEAKQTTLTSPVLSAIYAALFTALIDADEIGKSIKVIRDFYNNAASEDEAIEAAFVATGAMYYGIKNGHFKVIADNRNIAMLSKMKVESGVLNGVILYGNPKIIGQGQNYQKKTMTNMTVKECRKEFEEFIKTHNWTNEEKALIQHFDDDFPVPPEAYKMASMYIKSKTTKRPMINFMWRGITAYGKSTGVEIMSCILDMPLLKVTCFPTMETQNFLSDFVPDTSNYIGSLPTFDEIAYVPEDAYFALTGVRKEVTSQEVLEEYARVVSAQNSSSPRFKHVVSNYVKALTKGYIVEIQEASRIKDIGVLVGLNEYDRQGAMIPLIDGTYKKRHENALVIYTDNVGYASCRPLDPSVIRRCSLIIDSYDMPKERIKSRCIYNTGCDDATFEEMYRIYTAVETFCKDHDITEGALSVNELEMFIMAVMMGESTADAIHNCLISKATSDIDEQEEIIASLGTII